MLSSTFLKYKSDRSLGWSISSSSSSCNSEYDKRQCDQSICKLLHASFHVLDYFFSPYCRIFSNTFFPPNMSRSEFFETPSNAVFSRRLPCLRISMTNLISGSIVLIGWLILVVIQSANSEIVPSNCSIFLRSCGE